MKNKNKKCKVNFSIQEVGRFISEMKITIAHVLYAIVIVIGVCIFAALLNKCLGENFFSKFIADMVYDGAFHHYLYCKEGHNGLLTIVATFLGEIVLSGIALVTIIGYFRSIGEKYENGQFEKYSHKNHILFLGYDDMMVGTLKAACRSNEVVIAVPNRVKELRDILKSILSDAELKCVEFVQCRRDDIHDLVDRACILTASKIYIIGQPEEPNHDALNFKSLALVSNECKSKEKDTHIIINLQNQSSFSMLKKTELKSDKLKQLLPEENRYLDDDFIIRNCEYFNFYSNTAFGLLTDDDKIKLDWQSEKNNLAKCPDRQVHLVVMGMTEMGVAIVRETLKLAHPSGYNTRFKITMVDENAYEEMHYFIGRTKELFKYCRYEYHDYNNPSKYISHIPDNDFLDIEFDFVQCDVAHPLLMQKLLNWVTADNQLLSLVVCTKQSSKNMAVAMYLPRELREGDDAIPVWVYQESDDSMKHLLDDTHYKYIHPFSVGDHKVFTILRNETNSEKYSYAKKLALAYEEAYMGGKEEWTPEYADERWTKMSAMYRWSSIYNVFSMRIKLRAVGYDDIPVADIPDEKKTVIDETEHNRWNVEKLSDGFMPTSAEQHDKVMNELNKLLELYPQWYVNGIIDNDIKNKIEPERKEFAEYKNDFCHDNIRSNDDLEAYSKAKDRFLLNTYLKLIQKKELGQ